MICTYLKKIINIWKLIPDENWYNTYDNSTVLRKHKHYPFLGNKGHIEWETLVLNHLCNLCELQQSNCIISIVFILFFYCSDENPIKILSIHKNSRQGLKCYCFNTLFYNIHKFHQPALDNGITFGWEKPYKWRKIRKKLHYWHT